MIKKVFGTILGAFLGGTSLGLIELLSHAVYPPPEDLDPMDLDQLRVHISELPAGALMFIIAAYIVGSLVAGWVAGKITRSMTSALVAGGLLMIGGVVNVVLIPHPLWFTLASVIVYLPCAWLGGRCAGAGKSA
jgi:hypothetical protein